jgi:hypothetical protein
VSCQRAGCPRLGGSAPRSQHRHGGTKGVPRCIEKVAVVMGHEWVVFVIMWGVPGLLLGEMAGGTAR